MSEFCGIPIYQTVGDLKVVLISDVEDYLFLMADDHRKITDIDLTEDLRIWLAKANAVYLNVPVHKFDYNKAIVSAIDDGAKCLVVDFRAL